MITRRLKRTNKMSKTSQIELRYVGFWVRLLAFIIDSLAIMAILGLVALFMPVPDILSAVDMTNRDSMLALVPTLLTRLGFDAMFSAVVFLLLWNIIRSSLGKILFRAYIVDSSGQRARFGQLLVRYLGYFISLFCFGLGFIWIAFDPKKQGWHDKLAGTVVSYGTPPKSEVMQDD